MDGHRDLKVARAICRALLVSALLAATACSSQGGIKQAFGKTLQAVGLSDLATRERSVPLRLYAGDNLNAGRDDRALSLVVRVYQLRDIGRFEEATFDVFLDQQR